jgi:hypothetical protein
VEGVIQSQKDAWQMVVSLEILQRSVAVTLDRSVLKSVSIVKSVSKVQPKRLLLQK